MKKIFLFFYLLNLFSFTLTYSQTYTFEKILDEDLTSLTIFKNPFDNNKYLYRFGWTSFPSKIQIAKVDSLGNIINNIAFSHSIGTTIDKVLPISSGFLVGLTSDNYKVTMVKITNNNLTQWSKDYTLPFGYNFKPVYFDKSKNEIFSILSNNHWSGDSNIVYIHQADTNGNTLNLFSYEIDSVPPFKYMRNKDLIKLNNGNFLLISSIGDSYSNIPVFLFLDSLLNVISGHKLNLPYVVYGADYKVIRNDDVLLIAGYLFPSVGSVTSYIINLSTSLVQNWAYSTTIPYPSAIFFNDANILPDSTILIIGDYRYPNPGPFLNERDILIINMDSTGNVNWSKVVGAVNHNDRCNNFVYEENDGIYIAGMIDTTYQSPLLFNGLLLKTDLSGNTSCPGSAVSIAMNPFNVAFDTVVFTKGNFLITDSIIDLSPASGMTLIDICDGIVSVNEINFSENKIAIYPNPVVDELNISNLRSFSGGELKIYDIIGSVVHHEKINLTYDTLISDVSKLKNGIYFLELRKEDEKIVKKIIIGR